MRSLVFFPLLLALVTPFDAWSGPLETARAVASRAPPVRPIVPVRPIASLQPMAQTAIQGAVLADPATLCETAITTAEYVHRLPPRLLAAISLTESGRIDPATGRLRPWPWTLNAEGEGQFFETANQAIAAVEKLQARGVRSIDVGCLQVNLMYHPTAFGSLRDAFDPRGNANYAARFLNTLYIDGKDWAYAIGAYHSVTPALGDAYRVLVTARWQNGDYRSAMPGHAAYREVAASDRAAGVRDSQVYGAFAPSSRVYGAFAPR